MASLIENLLEMNRLFAEAASTDPATAVLLVLGTLLFAFSFGVFGYLALGAVVDLLIPDSSRRVPPEAGR
jgi:hypothetical protein